MAIMAHAKFHLSRLMLTLTFAIWASERPPPGPGEGLKSKEVAQEVMRSPLKGSDPTSGMRKVVMLLRYAPFWDDSACFQLLWSKLMLR